MRSFSGEGPRSHERLVRGKPPRLLIAGGLFAVTLLCAAAMPTSFLIESPGPVLDVSGQVENKPVVQVSQVSTYPSDTNFYMTTVSSVGNPDVGAPGLAVLGALLSRDEEVMPVRMVYSAEVNNAAVQTYNTALMDSSQDIAGAVAFQKAGMDVSMTLTVAGVPQDSPAAGKLQEGDVVQAISAPDVPSSSAASAAQSHTAGASDSGSTAGAHEQGESAQSATSSDKSTAVAGNAQGQTAKSDAHSQLGQAAMPRPTRGADGFYPAKTFMDLSAVLDTVNPGTDVIVRAVRQGKVFETTITTRPYQPDTTGWTHPGSMLGVFMTVSDVKLPGKVDYIMEGIGGPSAGTMFTMAILDEITPGSLGGDHQIAGTGAISWDGDVEEIGGIRHKILGARNAGATDFLAPAANCAQTIGYEPEGLNIWAIRTIDDAVTAAKAIASGHTDQLTPCSAVAGNQG
ncbi:PDZ domain-containing protein [Trueperella sp. LYQ143]|uniref:YlbL family protein n=1 Tax=unclassified Trueperella TaxID=2630174 RepID=UPI0039839573